MNKVACILLFIQNEEGTYDCGGYTDAMSPTDAVNVSFAFPKCVRHVVQADNLNELEQKKQECIENMKDKDWVQKHQDLLKLSK